MEELKKNETLLTVYIADNQLSITVFDDSGLHLSSKSTLIQADKLTARELTEILEQETRLNYDRIRIIYESNVYLFVPMPLFRTEDVAHYLSLQHKLAKNNQCMYNSVINWNTVNIFALPTTVMQAIATLFPNETVEHHMSRFLFDFVKPGKEDSVNVWIREGIVDIIVLKNSKLQLLNSFSFQTDDDICFHILNVYEQLSLNSSEIPVNICNVTKNSNIEPVLSRYVHIETSQLK